MMRYFILLLLLIVLSVKIQAQKVESKMDSLATYIEQTYKPLEKTKNKAEVHTLENKGRDLSIPDSIKNLKSNAVVENDLRKLKSIKEDSLRRKDIKDSLKAKAGEKLKGEAYNKASKIKELQPATEVAGYVKSLKKDSINIDKVAEEQLKKTGYAKELDKVAGQDPFKNVKSQTDKLNDQAKALQDKQQMEKYTKEKASKLAKADLAKFAPQIQTAQNEFMKYKKKAEWLKEGSEPNANSLKDTPIKKRFVYGGNIQLPSLSPLTIIAAPYIGYQLNKKITSGVSVTYKFNLDNNKIFKANNVGTEYGYRIFTDYKLIKSWFAHAEFEQLNKLIKSKDSDAVLTKLQTNGYIGAGRQIEVYKGWKLNATFLVNLLHKDLLYLNPNAFQFRVGVSK